MGIDDTLAGIQAELARLQPSQAFEAAGQPDTFIVDTRPEYQRRQSGEVPRAIVIERNHLEWRLDPACPARIPEAAHRNIGWIILCEGGFSSSLAAYSLRQIGLVSSTDVIGGFQAWQAAGLPVTHPETVQRGRMPGQAGNGSKRLR